MFSGGVFLYIIICLKFMGNQGLFGRKKEIIKIGYRNFNQRLNYVNLL